jgi:tetratricopeptide (TPR) repeat protein
MDLQAELTELIEKAEWAEKYSVEQSDILLRALRLAESLNDTKNTHNIREQYIDCLNTQGRIEDAYPHFSLLLSHLDDPAENVGLFDRISILWKYKWFLGSLPNFPHIPKAQIFDIMADMERRYLAFQPITQATVHYYKYVVYRELGEQETANAYYEKFEECKTSDVNWLTLSDCDACIQDTEVGNALSSGQWEQVIQIAQPILSGEKKCESVPQRTYFKVALALAKMGQMDEAAHYFEKGIQSLKEDRVNLDRNRRSICYLVYTGQWEQALAVFEQNFHQTLNLLEKSEIFHFYAAGLLLFRYLARTQSEVKMNLPDNPVLYQPDGVYQVPETVQILDRAVRELAAQFDQRNENDYYSRKVLGFYDWFMPEEH